MSNWVNFREVKTQIRLADVIRRYGVKLQSSGPGCLRGRCPLPTHSSKDSTLSFSINTARNVWACHSQSCIAKRGGSIGGNVLDFVAVMEGCTIRDAALILKGYLEVPGPSSSGNDRVLRPTIAASNRALGFRLFGVDPSHEYIAARGISLATARLFGIGFYHGHGCFSGRVVIPIHNPAGQLIAYAGRSINGEEPKYRFPPAFRKSSELFNLHRAAREPRGRVLVVEGFFDCVKVDQAGFPNVVALMGCSLSGQQTDLLTSYFAQAVLLMDGDDAGERATAKIAATLSGAVRVYRGRVPQGRQPDELVPAELRGVIEGATDASQ